MYKAYEYKQLLFHDMVWCSHQSFNTVVNIDRNQPYHSWPDASWETWVIRYLCTYKYLNICAHVYIYIYVYITIHHKHENNDGKIFTSSVSKAFEKNMPVKWVSCLPFLLEYNISLKETCEHEKNPLAFHYTGWLVGILICNGLLWSLYSSVVHHPVYIYNPNNQGPFFIAHVKKTIPHHGRYFQTSDVQHDPATPRYRWLCFWLLWMSNLAGGQKWGKSIYMSISRFFRSRPFWGCLVRPFHRGWSHMTWNLEAGWFKIFTRWWLNNPV